MTPTSPLDALAHYRSRHAASRALAGALGRRASRLSLMRVVAVLLAIALWGLARWRELGLPAWIGGGLCAAAFLILVVIHDRVLQRQRRAERSVAWADAGLARLEDRWAHDPGPADPQSSDEHSYAADLDVFGRGSLMQSLDTTCTVEGRKVLAAWLAGPPLLSEADAVTEIATRQACARDLAPKAEFRETLAVEGALLAREPPDVEPLLRWAGGPSKGASFGSSAVVQAAALFLPAATFALIALGGSIPGPRSSWLLAFALQLLLAARNRAPMLEAIAAASAHQQALARFERMFAVIEDARFAEPELEALRASMTGARAGGGGHGHRASVGVRRLGRIVGFVDARRNEVFRFFIGPFLSWDLNCALALERWRRRSGAHMRGHIEALARVEALAALATRAFERPDDAWPEVLRTGPSNGAASTGSRESKEGASFVRFEAKALGHPLIPVGKVVRNDVSLDGPGAALLVTGSNMSGKSTLLRAIGTNVVLALAGAPVRASALRTAPFQVHTSMRVRDSLSEGVSHFLAELRRLKQVIDAANVANVARDAVTPSQPSQLAVYPVLYLLDEILHGTNSRERHLGARAIVRHLVASGACGAISTHDLALASLADELPGRVVNAHFREQVEPDASGVERMTFDYRLRPDVVTSSNALRLMRIVGIEIPIPPPSEREVAAVQERR